MLFDGNYCTHTRLDDSSKGEESPCSTQTHTGNRDEAADNTTSTTEEEEGIKFVWLS